MTITYSKSLISHLKKVKVIGFDLDDTLWNNAPVIKAANETQFDYLEQVTSGYSREQIEQLYLDQVSQLIQQEKLKYQDMTLLRKSALKKLSVKLSLSPEVAEETFNRFFKARQAFQIYPEAIALLKLLSCHVKLIAISNGNAQVSGTVLEDFFDQHWRAGVQGEAKPSGDMLLKACNYYGVNIEQFVYVGDNPATDGMAAVNAGCLGLLVNPENLDREFEDLNIYRFKNLSALFDCFKLVYREA